MKGFRINKAIRRQKMNFLNNEQVEPGGASRTTLFKYGTLLMVVAEDAEIGGYFYMYPRRVAAIALLVGRMLSDKTPLWDDDLEEETGFSLGELEEDAQRLMDRYNSAMAEATAEVERFMPGGDFMF